MRVRLNLMIFLLGLLSQGCGPLYNVVRVSIVEPFHFCKEMNELIECNRNHELAHQAWIEEAQAHPGQEFSCDYEKGFVAGYSDYLLAGGPGNPPPVPPRMYWRAEYESPVGHQLIQDWYAGFRHGVRVAQESNYRQFVVIPTTAPTVNTPQYQFVNPSSPDWTPSGHGPGFMVGMPPDGAMTAQPAGGMDGVSSREAPTDSDLPPPRKMTKEAPEPEEKNPVPPLPPATRTPVPRSSGAGTPTGRIPVTSP